jgi:hypothetical protein
MCPTPVPPAVAHPPRTNVMRHRLPGPGLRGQRCCASVRNRGATLDSSPGDPMQRKRGHCDWPQRQGQQHDLVVIAGNSIQPQRCAPHAPVYDRPFSLWFRPNSYRLHSTLARGATISHLMVDVPAPQAFGAMVPLLSSALCACYELIAVDAMKRLPRRFDLRQVRQLLIPPNERRTKTRRGITPPPTNLLRYERMAGVLCEPFARELSFRSTTSADMTASTYRKVSRTPARLSRNNALQDAARLSALSPKTLLGLATVQAFHLLNFRTIQPTISAIVTPHAATTSAETSNRPAGACSSLCRARCLLSA